MTKPNNFSQQVEHVIQAHEAGKLESVRNTELAVYEEARRHTLAWARGHTLARHASSEVNRRVEELLVDRSVD